MSLTLVASALDEVPSTSLISGPEEASTASLAPVSTTAEGDPDAPGLNRTRCTLGEEAAILAADLCS